VTTSADRPAGRAAPRSQRRDHIVRLAGELFAEKGFQATTVRNIATEAGIFSGSLYHHFDSKESIADEILSSFFDQLMASYRQVLDEGGNPRDTIAGLVRVAFGSLERHRAAITVIQKDWTYLKSLDRFAYLAKFEDEVERLWVDVLRAGRDQGFFRADLDPEITYLMIRDTVWAAVRWFRPGGRLDAAALAGHYLGVIFDGIDRR
jgi:AcrR family transcriptional regulator